MKNTLFYLMIAFSSLLSAKAAEKPTSVPCYVVNEYWPSKAQLQGTVRYSDLTKTEISLNIDGFNATTQSPQQKVDLPFGSIDTIDLDLTNDNAGDDGTLLANLVINPTSRVKMVTFRIVENRDNENKDEDWGALRIVPDVVYG